MNSDGNYDAIIIGSGMGGMSTAALLAKDGYKVLVLEASSALGGCSSSYYRKGFVFESGATTLIGFDEHQPLWKLERETGMRIPREEINPSMTVWLDGEVITRYKDRELWIKEAGRVFGNAQGQRTFWEEALAVTDVVWEVSLKNPFFPPKQLSDWGRLITSNSPKDVWVLPHAIRSVEDVMRAHGVDTPKFRRFVDEQLMITAQAKSEDTPFLFGAAGLTYTNYSNFYVPGGLLEMIHTIRDFIREHGGELHTKEAAEHLSQTEEGFEVYTRKGNTYRAPVVVSNIPVWNMQDITAGDMKNYFQAEANEYNEAWGAITLGIATTDTYPDEMTLHHQLHVPEGETIPFTHSDSVFVSMSAKGDTDRAESGKRTLNVSTHASPELWYALDKEYEHAKETVEEYLLNTLREKLPGFKEAELLFVDTATPITWENWISRKKGRVGGIPQSMARSLLKWTPNQTPFTGLYLAGDTTYPGQGIPGVTLSGINVYWRIKQNKT